MKKHVKLVNKRHPRELRVKESPARLHAPGSGSAGSTIEPRPELLSMSLEPGLNSPMESGCLIWSPATPPDHTEVPRGLKHHKDQKNNKTSSKIAQPVKKCLPPGLMTRLHSFPRSYGRSHRLLQVVPHPVCHTHTTQFRHTGNRAVVTPRGGGGGDVAADEFWGPGSSPGCVGIIMLLVIPHPIYNQLRKDRNKIRSGTGSPAAGTQGLARVLLRPPGRRLTPPLLAHTPSKVTNTLTSVASKAQRAPHLTHKAPKKTTKLA